MKQGFEAGGADSLPITPRDPDCICLVQITDTHITHRAGAVAGVDTAASLVAVLKGVEALSELPDCMVLTGDLVDDPTRETYGRVSDILSERRYPVVCLPGNHDDPAMMGEMLNTGALSTRRVIDFGRWRVVMLNDREAGRAGGRLASTEIAFLDRELDRAKRTPVLICLHHQPVPIGSPWMDGMGLANAAEFLDVVDRYQNVRAVVWGHCHQEFSASRGGISLWGSPSTCVQFLPGVSKNTRDDRPPGFRVLKLLPEGALKSEVIRI